MSGGDGGVLARGEVRVRLFPGLALEPRLVHGVAERSADVSAREGGEGSRAARAAVLRALGLDPARARAARQVHGAEIAVVGGEGEPGGSLLAAEGEPPADGLATARAGLALLVSGADCPALFLFDPDGPAVALAHAGRRGTQAGIVSRAVAALASGFGAAPERLRAAVGPGIGRCCYEVSDDVADGLEAEVARAHLRRSGGRLRLDLPGWIRADLLRAGLAPGGIEMAPWCTACRTDLFFSHRAEGPGAGRCAAVAAIQAAGPGEAVRTP